MYCVFNVFIKNIINAWAFVIFLTFLQQIRFLEHLLADLFLHLWLPNHLYVA